MNNRARVLKPTPMNNCIVGGLVQESGEDSHDWGWRRTVQSTFDVAAVGKGDVGRFVFVAPDSANLSERVLNNREHRQWEGDEGLPMRCGFEAQGHR